VSSLDTLTNLITQQATAFEAFKQANDEQLAQLRAKGAADAVTVDKVEKLSAELDRLQDNFTALEKLATLPNRGAAGDDKAADRLSRANLELQSLAALDGHKTRTFADAAELQRYEADFGKYLRQGKEGVDLHAWVRQDFRVAVDGDGGFLVPPDMSGRIVRRLYETSSLRGLAFVQNTSRGELTGIADTADISFWWAGEAEPDQDATNIAVGDYQIQVEEMRTQPKASVRFLSDAAVDVEGWLAAKIADRLARGENDGFINGSGSGRPRGLVTYTTAATADGSRTWGQMQHVVTGANGGFVAAASGPADCLIDLVAALKPAYLANATWLARRATFAAIRKLKATDGQYLWQPSIQVGVPATLMGYPVREAEDMPAHTGAGALGVAFGDFREAYTIVDREGISVLRDPYTSKGYVKFFTRKRVGGGVVNFDAVKFLRFST
jgi:HK97 family phage major capsid protein